MQDNTFFSVDLNNQIQEHQRDQSPDPKEYLQTITVVNSSTFSFYFKEKSFSFFF